MNYKQKQLLTSCIMTGKQTLASRLNTALQSRPVLKDRKIQAAKSPAESELMDESVERGSGWAEKECSVLSKTISPVPKQREEGMQRMLRPGRRWTVWPLLQMRSGHFSKGYRSQRNTRGNTDSANIKGQNVEYTSPATPEQSGSPNTPTTLRESISN